MLAYPWFFVFGSLAVARDRRGTVQVTGAIVLNRVDVIAIHFCHRAFKRAVNMRRSQRRTPAYRLNAALAVRMKELAELLCYRPARTRHCVVPAEGVAREGAAEFPRLAHVTDVSSHGVDHDRVAPADSDAKRRARTALGLTEARFVAAFVGGEWDRKGLAAVIQALGLAPGWSLLVAGTGDQDAYAALADRFGVAEQVHFLGLVDDTPMVYAASDAFVLPTVYETFSLVTYEAAAAGLPLIASRASGIEDILDPGESGWFVDADAEQIAGRLVELAASSELRNSMGRAARRASLPYLWTTAIDRHDMLYRALSSASISAASASLTESHKA